MTSSFIRPKIYLQLPHKTTLRCCGVERTVRLADADSVPFLFFFFAFFCTHSPFIEGYSVLYTLGQHEDEVVGLSFHPSGDYVVTASADASWNFFDARTGQLYRSVADDKRSGYASVSFHPDGLLLGCGTRDAFVRIFDVKLQKNVASFSEGLCSYLFDPFFPSRMCFTRVCVFF